VTQAPPISERGSRTAGNLLYYGFAQVSSALLALVLIGILSRALGTVGFGAFSFSFVAASFGALIADFGVGPWLTRAVAQYRGQVHWLLADALRLRALMVLVAGGLTLMLARLYLRDPSGLANVAWMLVYVFLLGYVGVYEAVLMGKERADRVALSMGIGKVLELAAVLGWFVLGSPRGVAGAAAALAAACALRLVMVRTMVRTVLRVGGEAPVDRAGAREAHVARAAFRKMIREALPFAAGSAAWTTYFKVDVLILDRLGTPGGLGLYTAAYRVLEALILLPRSVVGVMYPVVSAAWSQGTMTSSLLSRPARAITALSLACAAGIWALSPEIMRFLFGASFVAGSGALRILGFALVPLFLNSLLSMVLPGTHRQGEWVMFTLMALLVNVTANLILIPRAGFEGAAWATLLSESFTLVLVWVAVARRHGRLLPVVWLARALLAAAAMGFLIERIEWPFLARVAVGIGTFAVAASLLRVILSSDWKVAFELMGRIRNWRPGDSGARPQN
jgi:O-antigen/teichoic acid export membrane protein